METRVPQSIIADHTHNAAQLAPLGQTPLWSPQTMPVNTILTFITYIDYIHTYIFIHDFLHCFSSASATFQSCLTKASPIFFFLTF